MPASPSARRAAAMRAALRHPDAVGVRALAAWADRAPRPAAPPPPDPARAARWAAALARPECDATILARGDLVLRAGRPGGVARSRDRWDADATHTAVGPVPAYAAGCASPRPGR